MPRDTIESLRRRLKRAGRAKNELERRMFHLKTLYDLSREIGLMTDIQEILTNLLMMVIGTFGAERGLIFLVDVKECRVEALSQLGMDSESGRAFREAAQAGQLKDLASLSAVQVLSLAGAKRRRRPPGLLGLLSALELSIWVRLDVTDRLVGAMGLGEKLTGERYTRDDSELLATLSNHGAGALRNASAHQELVRYAAELEASLRRIHILESVKANLAKFVPKTVQELIEESPDAPLLEKREIDCSVLFADITGYTRLSAQLDLDKVNRLVERYFGAFLDEILSRGGDVNETAGDGLMVIFRKKDPRRHARAAALAALGIQQRTGEINAQLRGQSEPIVMKIGVNSGIASVGATRIEAAAGTRWTYTASGPTTNVAARLAGLAGGASGSLIISEQTRSRLGDEFRVEDLGPQLLKNVDQPVRAFRLTGHEPTVVAPTPGPPLPGARPMSGASEPQSNERGTPRVSAAGG